MPYDLAAQLPTQADTTRPDKSDRGSCDLYVAIGRAVDAAMDAAVAGGLLLSLQMDAGLRGPRAAPGRGVIEAVQALIRAAGRMEPRGMVTVRAFARGDEVEVAVTAQGVCAALDGEAAREASRAARGCGARLEVAGDEERIVWTLSLFAPTALTLVLLIEPDAMRRVETAAFLGELDLRTDTAEGAEEAARRLSVQTYGAVVVSLDIGAQAARSLCDLARAGSAPPPVFAMADVERALSRGALRDVGFAGVIVRPLVAAQARAAFAGGGLQSKRPNS